MDLTSIGERIKQYRMAAGLSQSQLAEMTGISTKYVSVLERSAKPPSLETLINIANALNISSDLLLCDILSVQFDIKQTIIGERIKELPKKEQSKILAVVDVLIEQAHEWHYSIRSARNRWLFLFPATLPVFSTRRLWYNGTVSSIVAPIKRQKE